MTTAMLTGRILSVAGILLFGGMAGFFWSFSVVVMPGLGLSEPTTALAAMQAINLAVRNALFAVGFFGAALIAAEIAVQSLIVRRPTSVVQAGAALLYLAGVFGVTVIGNVPMNEALAAIDPSSKGAGAAMADYLRDWTALNHVRTVSALAATALLIWSLGRTGLPETRSPGPRSPGTRPPESSSVEA